MSYLTVIIETVEHNISAHLSNIGSTALIARKTTFYKTWVKKIVMSITVISKNIMLFFDSF